MSQKTLRINGAIDGEKITGIIDIGELVSNFDSDWLPPYQRDRVAQARKIRELRQAYENKERLPTISLNLRDGGDFKDDPAKPGHFVLSGQFALVDGQQRLLAARDVMATNFGQSVEVYIALTYEEEYKKFRTLNEKQTKVTGSDIIKGFDSPLSDLLRRTVANPNYPIKIVINRSPAGLGSLIYSLLLYWMYWKLVENKILHTIPINEVLKLFMEKTRPEQRDLTILEFAMRNLFQQYVETFGSFNHKSEAYRRQFFLAWNHIVIDNFIGKSGSVAVAGFKHKLTNPGNCLNDSEIYDVSRGGGQTYCHMQLYKLLLKKHFNWKMKNKLENPHADFYGVQQESAEERKFVETTLESPEMAAAVQ